MPGGGIPAAMKAPGGAINPCCALNAAAIKEVMVCINNKYLLVWLIIDCACSSNQFM